MSKKATNHIQWQSRIKKLSMKFVFVMIITVLSQKTAAQTCNLLIQVPNIKNTKGNIQVKIYNNEKSFPKADEQYREAVFKIDTIPGNYLIKGLPKGRYAIAILHDENSDKKCNMNFFGIPKEGYGFSNNFRPVLSVPVFKDCEIALIADTSIVIRLIY